MGGYQNGTYKGFSIETLNTFEAEDGVISTEKIQDVIEWLNSFSNIDMNFKKIVKAKLAAMLGKFGNVTTDKAVLSWDGDGELEAGMDVFIEDADGNRNPADDGDYTTEDGKVIVVVDGKVSEIKDPNAEVAPEGGEEENELKASKMAKLAKFEESYEEKERKIAEAIAAKNGEGFYFYIVEAGEGYAVICWWTDEDYSDHFRRYDVSENEDGTFTLGAETDGHMGFIPDEAPASAEPAADEDKEEMQKATLAILDEMKTMKSEMAAIKAQLKEPAAKPAHEEFSGEGGKINAPKGMEKFAKRFSQH